MGELEKAMEDVELALQRDSNQYFIIDTRGEILIKMAKYYEAIADFTEAIRLNDKSKDSYKKRAECYRKLANRERNEQLKEDYLNNAKADEDRASNLQQIRYLEINHDK